MKNIFGTANEFLISFHKCLMLLFIFIQLFLADMSNALNFVIIFLASLIVILYIGTIKKFHFSEIFFKVFVICALIILFIFCSWILGHSTGVAGNIFLQIEFFLCLLNYVFLLCYYDDNDKKTIFKGLAILSVLSLLFNICINIVYPEIRYNLYNDTMDNIFFVGGFTYAYYISLFASLIFYSILFIRKHLGLNIFLLGVSLFYILGFSPSATVVILFAFNIVLITFYWFILHIDNKRVLMLLLLILAPVLIILGGILLINILPVDSRLYARVNAIFAVIKEPISLMSNVYFERFVYIITDIKTFTESLSTFLIGRGYDFTSYGTITEQLSDLGIGFHCSLFDWFPMYGVFVGLGIWYMLYLLYKAIKNNYEGKCIINVLFINYILFCLLNDGFIMIVLTGVALLVPLYFFYYGECGGDARE